MAQRPSLKGKLLAERRAMFAHGASPSDAEYDRFLAKVRETPGYEFYTSKTHSNYRSRLRPRRKATAAAARRVSQSVQTAQDDASEGAVGWGEDAHTAHWQQWRDVGHHVPPGTPTSDASSSTRSDYAPLLEDATAAELAHTAQQWDGVGHHLPPTTPSSDASSSTRSDCAPLLEDTTVAELAYGTLAMRAPVVLAQIRAARDPTVSQFEQWAAASGLPAVELFRLFIAVRSGHGGLPPEVPDVAREYDDGARIASGVVGAEPPATACGMWGETSPVYSGPFPVPYGFEPSF